MMLEIVKILISLPASIVATMTLVRLVTPGKGRHRKP